MGKKATFILDEELMKEVKSAVNKGLYKSMNAFVETAIKDELEKIKKEQIKSAIVDAGKDPLFLADIEEINKDFLSADFDMTEK